MKIMNLGYKLSLKALLFCRITLDKKITRQIDPFRMIIDKLCYWIR